MQIECIEIVGLLACERDEVGGDCNLQHGKRQLGGEMRLKPPMRAVRQGGW